MDTRNSVLDGLRASPGGTCFPRSLPVARRRAGWPATDASRCGRQRLLGRFGSVRPPRWARGCYESAALRDRHRTTGVFRPAPTAVGLMVPHAAGPRVTDRGGGEDRVPRATTSSADDAGGP